MHSVNARKGLKLIELSVAIALVGLLIYFTLPLTRSLFGWGGNGEPAPGSAGDTPPGAWRPDLKPEGDRLDKWRGKIAAVKALCKERSDFVTGWEKESKAGDVKPVGVERAADLVRKANELCVEVDGCISELQLSLEAEHFNIPTGDRRSELWNQLDQMAKRVEELASPHGPQ